MGSSRPPATRHKRHLARPRQPRPPPELPHNPRPNNPIPNRPPLTPTNPTAIPAKAGIHTRQTAPTTISPIPNQPPPSFLRKQESIPNNPHLQPSPQPPTNPTVIPAKAGIHTRQTAPSNISPIPNQPPPSFLRKQESTPLNPHPPTISPTTNQPPSVIPAKAGIHTRQLRHQLSLPHPP